MGALGAVLHVARTPVVRSGCLEGASFAIRNPAMRDLLVGRLMRPSALIIIALFIAFAVWGATQTKPGCEYGFTTGEVCR